MFADNIGNTDSCVSSFSESDSKGGEAKRRSLRFKKGNSMTFLLKSGNFL